MALPTRAMVKSNWAMVKSNRAMVKSNWAIDRYYALPKMRRRQCRVPTNLGLHRIILGRRETALPCPPSPHRAIVSSNWAMVKSNWAMVKSNWAIDLFYALPEIRRRQCRVPTNPGLHTTILRRRETALPCPPSLLLPGVPTS